MTKTLTLRALCMGAGLLFLTGSDCDTGSTVPSPLFPGPPPPANGDITGLVVLEDDGEGLPNNPPIANATVVLGRESAAFGTVTEIARTQSGADGRFAFDFSCSAFGSYRLWVEVSSESVASEGGRSCGTTTTLVVPR